MSFSRLSAVYDTREGMAGRFVTPQQWFLPMLLVWNVRTRQEVGRRSTAGSTQQHAGSQIGGMEKSYAGSCKGDQHCWASWGARDCQEPLHYINSKHVHDVFPPCVTHQIEPGWLSHCRDRGSWGQGEKWKDFSRDRWHRQREFNVSSRCGTCKAPREAVCFVSFKAFSVSFVEF